MSNQGRARPARAAALVAIGVWLAACGSDDSGGDAAGAGGSTGAGGASASGGGPAHSGGQGGGPGSGGSKAGGGTGSGGGPGGRPSSSGGVSSGGGPGSGGALDGGASDGGSPGEGCEARPDGTNTGVRPGVSLTVVDGDVTVTEDGTVLEAQDIHGFLVVRASRVTIRNCRVRGGPASSNGAGLRVQQGEDVLVEDTEIGLDAPSVYLDAVSGSNVTLRRVNVHGGVDGMKLGSNSTVECSYIHDMASFASDPNQGGGATHNDAIQILSGTGIRIADSTLIVSTDQNAAIQVTQDFGHVEDLTITGNYADGGGCTFNLSHKGEDDLTGVTVTDNRFGRNSFFDCPILKSTMTTAVLERNVWDDDGTDVRVQTHD